MFKRKNCKIPLDKFINSALYHPTKVITRTIYHLEKGDFVTAPNISIFFRR